MFGTKKAFDKLKLALRPNNYGWIFVIVGLVCIFLGKQINSFAKTDVNYSFFGGVLVICGFILWLSKTDKRRR